MVYIVNLLTIPEIVISLFVFFNFRAARIIHILRLANIVPCRFKDWEKPGTDMQIVCRYNVL